MRPSCTSFSRLIRATSRRTGSKQLTTTSPGVSSMMTSTPVAFSKLLMFLPSLPITRPLRASSVMATLLVVCSLVCSEAYFWMAATMICRALSRPSSWASSTLRRMISPASWRHSSSTRRRSSSRACSGDTPASCSSRSRCSTSTAVSCTSWAATFFSRPFSCRSASSSTRCLTRQRVQLAVDRLLLLGDPGGLVGHLPGLGVQLPVELLADLHLLGLGRQLDLLGPRLRLPPGGLPQGVGVGPGAGHHLLPAEGQKGVQPDRPDEGGDDPNGVVMHTARRSSPGRPRVGPPGDTNRRRCRRPDPAGAGRRPGVIGGTGRQDRTGGRRWAERVPVPPSSPAGPGEPGRRRSRVRGGKGQSGTTGGRLRPTPAGFARSAVAGGPRGHPRSARRSAAAARPPLTDSSPSFRRLRGVPRSQFRPATASAPGRT